jgi:hypothetical protein
LPNKPNGVEGCGYHYDISFKLTNASSLNNESQDETKSKGE